MALIWGVNFSVVKFGTTQVDPLAFNGTRVVLAVGGARGRSSWQAHSRGRAAASCRAARRSACSATASIRFLFVEGIARTRAGDAALLVAASPAFIAIIGRLRGTERTGATGVAGIALSLSGIALVVFGDSSGASHTASLIGDLLVLVACLCWAIYTVFLQPYTERVDGVTLSAVTMIGGAVPLALASLPALARTNWSAVGVGGWAAVAYSGLLALVVAYLFWYRGVRVLGPTRTAMYSNLQPIIALGCRVGSLGETPHLLQLVGAACIMGGLLLTRLQAAPVNPPCE